LIWRLNEDVGSSSKTVKCFEVKENVNFFHNEWDVFNFDPSHVKDHLTNVSKSQQQQQQQTTTREGNGRIICPYFMIVASDGLWEGMSFDEATNFVLRQIQDQREEHYIKDINKSIQSSMNHENVFSPNLENEEEGEYTIDFQLISQRLAHESLMRGSRDNIGVYIVDLSNSFSKE